MKLKIDGQTQEFVPLADFRKAQALPEEFAVAHFESKNRTDLGSLDGAGHVLAQIKLYTLQAIPPTIKLPSLIDLAEALREAFYRQLLAANTEVGLSPVEVDFAVAGFDDVVRAVAYELVQLNHTHGGDPDQILAHLDFPKLYQLWLDDAARVASESKTYQHNDIDYQVQVVYNPYGRVGLRVLIGDTVHYVADSALACPAASFMYNLCAEVAERVTAAFAASLNPAET